MANAFISSYVGDISCRDLVLSQLLKLEQASDVAYNNMFLRIGRNGIIQGYRGADLDAAWKDSDATDVVLTSTPNSLLTVTTIADLYTTDGSISVSGMLDNVDASDRTVTVNILDDGVSLMSEDIIIGKGVTSKTFSVFIPLSSTVANGSDITVEFSANDTGVTLKGASLSTELVATKAGAYTPPSTVIQFTPQTDPGVGEGQVFYDSATHTLAVKNDTDMTLNVGLEEIIRVKNVSGSTIPNGTAIRVSGVDGGVPTILRAQANHAGTASVPGITTHDILNGAEGFITHAGSLGGDFSAFNAGDNLWLSDTVAGGMQVAVPDLATFLGVVTNNAVDGSMIVKINSLIEIPTVIGYLNNGTIPAGVTATPALVANYTSGGNIVSPVNQALGTVGIPYSGIYRATGTFNIGHDDVGNNSGVATIHINDGTSDILTIGFGVARNQVSTNMAFNIPFQGIAGQELRMLVSSTENLDNPTFSAVSFDVKSENIR